MMVRLKAVVGILSILIRWSEMFIQKVCFPLFRMVNWHPCGLVTGREETRLNELSILLMWIQSIILYYY